MYKFLIGFSFLISAVLFGWEMNRYATSGIEIAAIPVQGNEGSISNLYLKGEMAPVRLLLVVDYEIELQQGSNTAYEYELSLAAQGEAVFMQESGVQMDQHSDQGSSIEDKNSSHIIGTFSPLHDGAYEVVWSLSPKDAQISRATVKLRRNVSELNISWMLGAGFFFILGGSLLFLRSRFSGGSE
ncbi:hypothetical protein [Sneathiella glossodoripedis]|uniref:hypothetical protein n=1 Tax=Sneathiella glossodoripedis TaxID=418853 RepID=UPI0004702D2E|nr:hypothetical protein [Sneathiella glossodoripedis]